MFYNIKTQLLFDFAVQTFSPEISRIFRQRSKSSTALRRRRWRSLYSYLWAIYSLFLWIFHGKALSLQHNKTDICI